MLSRKGKTAVLSELDVVYQRMRFAHRHLQDQNSEIPQSALLTAMLTLAHTLREWPNRLEAVK